MVADWAPAGPAAHDTVRALAWQGGCLELLDQRLLPHREHWLRCTDAASVARAIRQMAVRGAPAIGIAAAYGAVLAAREAVAEGGDWRAGFARRAEELAATRPTAVNLSWALARMRAVAERAEAGSVVERLEREAQAVHGQDVAANRAMGRLGAALLGQGARVLTHCNAGSLATGGYGTALGVVRAACSDGRLAGVWCTETRPWLQGARLTAWELARDGIPPTLVADAAVAALIERQRIDWVIVGADRVAANGDVANKIGTCTLALVARALGARVMVVAPSSTLDPATPDGAAIPIEERAAEELTRCAGAAVAPPGVAAWNPVFDVTPAELVDVLVTEHGIASPPDRDAVARLVGAPGSVLK